MQRKGGSDAVVAASPVPTAQLMRIRAALASLAALTMSASQGLSSMEAGMEEYDMGAR